MHSHLPAVAFGDHLLPPPLALEEGESEAIILVTPASQSGRQADAMYCAGVTPDGQWVRLYPGISGKSEDIRIFKRWNRIRFKWQQSIDDLRAESRRIDHDSIRIIGELPQNERHEFLSKLEVAGLNGLADQGKSLALLRPQNPHFFIERKSEQEITDERQAYERDVRQGAASHEPISFDKPRPYKFKYRYSVEEGDREEICEGSEINTIFANLSASLGEAAALAWIIKVFGKEYVEKGVVFAMGTHALDAKTWQINGIICMDEVYQVAGHHFNVVV